MMFLSENGRFLLSLMLVSQLLEVTCQQELLTTTISTTAINQSSSSSLYNNKRNLRYHQQLVIQERIVGGKPAVAGSYPSYAIATGRGLCGSTLIHDDILITAAHCYGLFQNGIVLGVTSFNGITSNDVRQVDIEYPNPNFNEYTLGNDVMLVKLTTPVSDTSIITQYNIDTDNPIDEQTVTVIGFGAQEENGTPSNDLLEVQIQIVNYNDCYDAYWQPFFGSNIQNDLMICANGIDNETGGTLDSCQG